MKTREIIVLMMLVLISFPAHSHAYIDPGTGSFVIQMVVAAVLGAFFALKMYWRRLKGFFSKFTAKEKKNSDDTG